MEAKQTMCWQVCENSASVYVLNARRTNRFFINVQPGADDNGKRISDEELRERAEFIARASNAHDALVDAARMGRYFMLNNHVTPTADELKAMDDAIAKAGAT